MAGNFNGSTQYIDLGATTTTRNKAAITMCFWALTKVFRDVDSWYSYSTGTSVTAARFGIKVAGTAGNNARPQLRCRATDGEALNTFDQAGTPLVAGQWHHIAGSCNYATSTGALYVDGVLQAVGPFATAFGAGVTSNTDSLSASIGAREDGTAQWINALIADCRLYDRILNTAEVLTIYTAKGGDGIVAGLQDRFFIQGPPSAVIASVPNLSILGLGGNGVSSPTYITDVIKARRRTRYQRSAGH